MKVFQKSFGGMNNNAFLIVDESTNESALVDCPEFNNDMKELIGDTDLKYILLTHGHYDHILGTKAVKEKYGCKVVIAKEDEPMLSSTKLSLGAFCNALHEPVSADVIVNDGDIINVGNLQIKVLATPGHTKGCVCYMVEDYLFTGDTLFYTNCGRTDLPGGNGVEMYNSLQRLKNLDGDYKVMTGHDDCSTLEFERQHNPYMK